MNYVELIRMNTVWVWINYNLYEFVWCYTERRVATGGSLAFTACVCESIQNIACIMYN